MQIKLILISLAITGLGLAAPTPTETLFRMAISDSPALASIQPREVRFVQPLNLDDREDQSPPRQVLEDTIKEAFHYDARVDGPGELIIKIHKVDGGIELTNQTGRKKMTVFVDLTKLRKVNGKWTAPNKILSLSPRLL